MADLRKLLFVLAVATLVFSVTASAQVTPAFQCVANAAVPPTVRAEGLTELVGDLVLNCTGGTPTAVGVAVPRVNIQIFLNTNVTSRLLDDPTSEAALMIDEPAEANQRLCTGTTGLGTPCTATGVGGSGLNYSGPSSVTTVPNVYQGRQSGANSIVWLGVPLDPPGTTSTRIIRIKNVRANASQLGVSATLTPTQIVEFISVTGETSVPINNPQQIVAFVQQGLQVARRDKGGGSQSAAERRQFQCIGVNEDTAGNPAETLDDGLQARIRFTELFATAFKRRNAAAASSPFDSSPTPINQATPTGVDPATGLLFNTETGYYNAALAAQFLQDAGDPPAGLADFGTRLRVVFGNVPAGVQIFVTVREVRSDPSNSVRLRLVNTDASGAGAFAAVPATNTSEGGMAPVTITGGTGVAVWEVMYADPLQISFVEVGVALAYVDNTAANLPGVGAISISGSFAPISTVTTASETAPVPRFADTGTATTIQEIVACATNLLFPFVSNQAGFDTGIAISNTSQDPFGTSTQAGPCTLNYYGSTTGGGAAPSAQTSGTVPAGSILAFTLSTGGNLGITGTPGFQGYIIAQCKFQYAHGFAFISDVGAQRLSHGYLALVLDAPLGCEDCSSRTVYSSESLGQ